MYVYYNTPEMLVIGVLLVCIYSPQLTKCHLSLYSWGISFSFIYHTGNVLLEFDAIWPFSRKMAATQSTAQGFYTPRKETPAVSAASTCSQWKHRVRMLKAVRFSFAMIKYLTRPFASHAPEYYTDHHLWQNGWQKETQLRWNQPLWTLQDFNKAASYFILCHFNNTMIISVPLPEPGRILFRCHVFRLDRLRRLEDVIKSSRW